MCWVRIVFLGSYDVQRWLSNSFGVLEQAPLVDPATLASGLSACCTTVANGLSLIIITALNKRQGLNTLEDEQISLYTKLSVALVANTVLVPLAYGVIVSMNMCVHSTGSCELVQQSWYEAGGVLEGALLYLPLYGLYNSCLLVLPPEVLWNRYVRAPFAASRGRLNQLWLPHEMPLGELYAKLTMLLAVGLVYAPLDPTFQLVVALCVGVNLAAVRYAIAHWYRRPGTILFSLADRLRAVLAGTLALYILVAYLGELAAIDPSQTRAADLTWPLLTTLAVLGVWYLLFLFQRRLVGFEPYDELLAAELEGDDTHGVAFHEVYGIERYACPVDVVLNAGNVDAECFKHGFKRGYVDCVWKDTHALGAAQQLDEAHSSSSEQPQRQGLLRSVMARLNPGAVLNPARYSTAGATEATPTREVTPV